MRRSFCHRIWGCIALLALMPLLAAAQAAEGSLSIRMPLPERVDADRFAAQLRALGFSPVDIMISENQAHVVVGLFFDELVAMQAAQDLLDEGFLNAEVVRASTLTAQGPVEDPIRSFPWNLLALGGGALLALAGIALFAVSMRRPKRRPLLLRQIAPARPIGAVHTPATAYHTPATPYYTPVTAVHTPGGRLKPVAPPVLPTPADAKRRQRLPQHRSPVPLFSDEIAHLTPGAAPTGWQLPQEGVASLKTIADSSKGTVLDFVKVNAGSGGFCWCELPHCTGEIVVEMDAVCHHKNKFLLGIYLQEGQDFLRAIATQIVGDSDSDGKCRLRMHQEERSIAWGEWVHLMYEIDLHGGRVVAHIDGHRVGLPADLTNPPAALDTLVIRTAPETLGHLSLANVRIWSASELRSAELTAAAG